MSFLQHFYNLYNRTKESAGDRDGLHPEHLAKRPCTVSPSQRFSPSSGLPAHPPPNGLPTHPPNGLPHPNPPAPQHYRLEDMALAHHYRDAYRHAEHRDVRDRHRQTGQSGVVYSKINQKAPWGHVYSDFTIVKWCCFKQEFKLYTVTGVHIYMLFYKKFKYG